MKHRQPGGKALRKGWVIQESAIVSAFILSLALIVFNSSVSYRNVDALISNGDRLSRSFQIQRSLDVLRSRLDEARARQRIFIDFGVQEDLASYRIDRDAAQRELVRLDRLIEKGDARRRDVDVLRPLVEAEVSDLDSEVNLPSKGVRTSTEDRMAAIHSALTAMSTKEARFISGEESHLRHRAGAARTATVINALVAIGLLLGLLAFTEYTLASFRRRREENTRLAEELEQIVRVRTHKLQQANEELEAFSSSVSHDLRAPLRAINASMSMLKEDLGEVGEEVQGHLRRMKASSRKMADLIEDLMRLSRASRSELSFETVDLTRIFQDHLEEASRRQPHPNASWSVESDLQTRGDLALVDILVNNLIRNAWKFSSKRDCPRVECGKKIIEGETCFFVRDNGIGFSPDDAAKLFKPFMRLDSSGMFEGTGVGLTICARVVERHGGRIWAEGQLDKGATFYFTLAEPWA